MQLWIKVIVVFLLWTGLPLIFLIHARFSIASPVEKSALLFILYSGFSWSIALLAFIMESARRQFFRQQPATPTALRLGLYGLFAVTLAMLTSPGLGKISYTLILQLSALGFVYCFIAGFVYWLFLIKAD